MSIAIVGTMKELPLLALPLWSAKAGSQSGQAESIGAYTRLKSISIPMRTPCTAEAETHS